MLTFPMRDSADYPLVGGPAPSGALVALPAGVSVYVERVANRWHEWRVEPTDEGRVLVYAGPVTRKAA